MTSKQDDSISVVELTNDIVEQNDEVDRLRGLKFTNEDSFNNNTTTRFRSRSCSYVPRVAINPGKAVCGDAQVAPDVRSTNNVSVGLNRRRKTSLPNSPIREDCLNVAVTQDTTNTGNTFVGLNRRRKNSLPSPMLLKPGEFLEGGRFEVAKREVNLDACMPVFAKDASAGKMKHSRSTSPITTTEFNGWMLEDMEGKISQSQGRPPRQRRISLPVLKVDGPDSQMLPSCTSVPSTQSGYLSPISSSPIPPVEKVPLVGKRTEMRTWEQKF